MTDKTHLYPAGTAIAFSTGEYSDFGYIAHVVTLKQLNLPERMQEFKDSFKPADEWDEPSPENFVAWLVSQGHCFPADVSEAHIGSYGGLEL